ncbi:unnamed protein product [Spirodela intermedia]|uniref:NAC domain-containing protein n=1 Tax=Spirodela intermedia TaxID=51605 RepID=A0A7I8II88_SPIIN|nr:unnamed protein product [Spirodela intermedia]CAA6657581.1 unnamed protein product [Spirodela intermedia]
MEATGQLSVPLDFRYQPTDEELLYHKDKKYRIGTRTNRATDGPAGNDSKRIGVRKNLVFYTWRAPRGQKTDWIMHEYRLLDDNPGIQGKYLLHSREVGPWSGGKGKRPVAIRPPLGKLRSTLPAAEPRLTMGGGGLWKQQQQQQQQQQQRFHGEWSIVDKLLASPS